MIELIVHVSATLVSYIRFWNKKRLRAVDETYDSMQPAKEGPMPVFQIDSIVKDYRFFGD